MTSFYCRLHVDFEGLDLAQLFDHVEKDHPEILQGELTKGSEGRQRLEQFYNENLFALDGPRRIGDSPILSRAWGRPPKLGLFVADNERDKKR